MNTTIPLILLIVLWYASGFFSFVYWWTRKHDFSSGEIWLACFIGLIGPFAYPLGWYIHTDDRPSKVIVKKRDE